ncbi:MAG: low affinity iron permease family protein [Hyphomicrobium sp.]|nr:low affinity iron permease family protein [Hyphomicrobium sp.]
MKEQFREFSERMACWTGTYWAFLLALVVVAAWALTGPIFSYSDTLQLVINTGTTIVTFLMVFLIQNTQNRESQITALKLDELLRAVQGARTGFVNLEHMTDEELEAIRREFERLREKFAPMLEDDLAHVEREIATRRK